MYVRFFSDHQDRFSFRGLHKPAARSAFFTRLNHLKIYSRIWRDSSLIILFFSMCTCEVYGSLRSFFLFLLLRYEILNIRIKLFSTITYEVRRENKKRCTFSFGICFRIFYRSTFFFSYNLAFLIFFSHTLLQVFSPCTIGFSIISLALYFLLQTNLIHFSFFNDNVGNMYKKYKKMYVFVWLHNSF